MNDITVFIFGISFAAVVGATFAFMWRMTGSVLEDVKKPRKPQRTVHPEMRDVETGDELLVFVRRRRKNECMVCNRMDNSYNVVIIQAWCVQVYQEEAEET